MIGALVALVSAGFGERTATASACVCPLGLRPTAAVEVLGGSAGMSGAASGARTSHAEPRLRSRRPVQTRRASLSRPLFRASAPSIPLSLSIGRATPAARWSHLVSSVSRTGQRTACRCPMALTRHSPKVRRAVCCTGCDRGECVGGLARNQGTNVVTPE